MENQVSNPSLASESSPEESCPFLGSAATVNLLWGFVTELCFVFSGKVADLSAIIADCIRMNTETNFETRSSLMKQNSNFPVSLPCFILSSAELNEKVK